MPQALRRTILDGERMYPRSRSLRVSMLAPRERLRSPSLSLMFCRRCSRFVMKLRPSVRRINVGGVLTL